MTSISVSCGSEGSGSVLSGVARHGVSGSNDRSARAVVPRPGREAVAVWVRGQSHSFDTLLRMEDLRYGWWI